MATFTYTALRNLKSGHLVDTEYTITSTLQQQDDEQPRGIRKENKALDGSQVTILHRIERYIDVVTELIQVSGGTPDVDDFEEFFSSVAGGEQFTFNDGSDHTVILNGDPGRQRRGLHFVYSFRMRVLS